jgi:hypothetical protein
MNVTRLAVLAVFSSLALAVTLADVAGAQQPQIPTLQVCNKTAASGLGTVKILSRSDISHDGSFGVRLDVKCDPASTYPSGSLSIFSINMSDSLFQGTLSATTFDQMTSTGKHTPTFFVNGRCTATGIIGCCYWLMIADNKAATDPSGTPDVVSFLVFDGTGKRIAYGTGPLADGDVAVTPTSN